MAHLPHSQHVSSINSMIYENDTQLLRNAISYAGKAWDRTTVECNELFETLKPLLLDESYSKIKPKKDLNAPKRPSSSYFIYADSVRDEIRKQDKNMSMGDVSKKTGEMWNKLTPDEKKVYEDKAIESRAEYDKALAQYENSLKDAMMGSLSGPGTNSE